MKTKLSQAYFGHTTIKYNQITYKGWDFNNPSIHLTATGFVMSLIKLPQNKEERRDNI